MLHHHKNYDMICSSMYSLPRLSMHVTVRLSPSLPIPADIPIIYHSYLINFGHKSAIIIVTFCLRHWIHRLLRLPSCMHHCLQKVFLKSYPCLIKSFFTWVAYSCFSTSLCYINFSSSLISSVTESECIFFTLQRSIRDVFILFLFSLRIFRNLYFPLLPVSYLFNCFCLFCLFLLQVQMPFVYCSIQSLNFLLLLVQVLVCCSH